MAIVGTSIAIAPALADYPVLAGQAWRYLLAGLILAALLVNRTTPAAAYSHIGRLYGFRGRRWFAQARVAARSLSRVSPSNAWRLIGIAVTGLAAFNWLLIEGTRHADPAFMASVVGATPVVLALAGPLTAGSQVRPATVAGSALVLAGIVLVHGATGAPLVALPYALGFLACEVAFTLLAVPVLRELTPLELSASVCLIAAPMLAVLSIFEPGPSLQVPTGTETLALLYMAVLTTAVAFLLWYSGVSQLGADRAGLFVGIMPIAGYLAGLVIGTSAWAVPALVGVTLCGLGIALGISPGSRRPHPDDPTPRHQERRHDYRLSRWKRRTASGRKIAVMINGQTTDISSAFCSIQVSPTAGGLPNNSRAAVTVEDTGFHNAMVPSQAGISDGATKTLEIIANGKATANKLPAASSFGTRSPSQTPTQMSAKRSRRNRPKAVKVPRMPPCERQPTTSAVIARTRRSSVAAIRSPPPRPVTTAEGAIGMDRNRSVTPLVVSNTTAYAVFMNAMAMVIPNSPGMRNSR
jgi:drug/metabolite transporter (DMT)-like permease